MKEAPRLIRRAATAELLRIAVFLVYYLALIALGAAILCGTFLAVRFIVLEAIPQVRNGRAVVGLVLVSAGLGALALMFGFYLVKPIFSFTRDRDPGRAEVRREDCPALFALVDAIAARTGCPRPKRVFLSNEVNAAVFYDTSFWSIFLPVRKNLEVGLGLLDGTSEAELAGVLAHEFGHFGQRSMKIGSGAAVTGVVLRNLILADDRWDRLLDRWCEGGVHWIWTFFGRATRFLSNGVRRFTVHVFSFVEKGNLALSRLMEFGADDAACAVVGSDAFASALCKIRVLAESDATYWSHLLHGALLDGLVPEDPAAARRSVPTLLGRESLPALSFDAPLAAPPPDREAPSRIRVDDPWSSHPPLADRLANVRANAVPPPADAVASPSRPASALVPEALVLRVARRAVELAAPPPDEGAAPRRPIDQAAFEAWTRDWVARGALLPEALEPFLQRDVAPFDLAAVRAELPDPPCPLTEGNAALLAEQATAESDLATLEAVASGESGARAVAVDGVVVRRKNLPVAAFRARAGELRAQAAAVDRALYAWLRAPLAGDSAAALDAEYAALFRMSEALSGPLPALLARREAILEAVAGRDGLPEELHREVCNALGSLEKDLREAILSFDRDDLLAGVPPRAAERARDVFAWAGEGRHCRYDGIDADVANRTFDVLGMLESLVFNRRGRARTAIARACERALEAA